MHGHMLKLGNPFLTQWQRRYFYLFPNRLEWRGEGESRVSPGRAQRSPRQAGHEVTSCARAFSRAPLKPCVSLCITRS